MNRAYQKMAGDQNAHAQPRIKLVIATYIGFRENLYGPEVTRWTGGDHGASVPLPLT